jgi:hypothetical protein
MMSHSRWDPQGSLLGLFKGMMSGLDLYRVSAWNIMGY